jgi:hypothetical protein
MAQSASYSSDGSRSSREAQEKRQFLFDSIPVQDTLQQNLIGQLNQSVLSGSDRKAAELVIGNIDDNGFLQSTPEEMALNSGIPREDFEKRWRARPARMFAHSTTASGKGEHSRVQDRIRAHGRSWQATFSGDRAPNGR